MQELRSEVEALIRSGGFAKVDAIYDFKPAGHPDQFEVPTIPVGPDRNDVSHFELHAPDALQSASAAPDQPVLRAHLIRSPAPTWTMGLETLHGKLDVQDGRGESANRVKARSNIRSFVEAGPPCAALPARRTSFTGERHVQGIAIR